MPTLLVPLNNGKTFIPTSLLIVCVVFVDSETRSPMALLMVPVTLFPNELMPETDAPMV